jgi:hypothetical protein
MTFGAMDKITDHYRDVGKGWHKLLEQAHVEIQAVNPEYEVLQVKEKFGGLRLYLMASREGQDIAHKYEQKSYEVCEFCGKPGSLDQSHFWLNTLCDEHKERRNTYHHGDKADENA